MSVGGSVSRQVEILEQFLLDLEESFGDDDATLVNEVRRSVESLEERVVRRRISGHVADLVRQGKAREAQQLMRRHFPGVGALEAVQQVLQLAYQDAKSLQSAVEFVGLCEPSELLLAAFDALFSAVQLKMNHSSDKLEMLVLKLSIDELDIGALAGKEDGVWHQLIHQVNVEYFRIVVGIVDQFIRNDLSLVEQITGRFGPLLLDRIIPDVVENFCAGSLDKVLQLVAFSRKLPHTSNRCSLVGAVWLQFVQRRQGETSAELLMHLWAHAMAIKQERQLSEVGMRFKYFEEMK